MQIVKFYKYYLSIFGVNSWHNSFFFSNLYPFSPNSNNIARCSYFFFFFFSLSGGQESSWAGSGISVLTDQLSKTMAFTFTKNSV